MKYLQSRERFIGEAVEVRTNRYQRAHGKKPRGFGQWAFYFDDIGGDPIFAPKAMNYSDAVKWAKGEAKKAGKREIYVGESLNEARKPKSWDTMFAMNAIKAYQNGEFDLNDKKSILAWDTEYNGGRAPQPAFDTKEIIDYAIKTGKKPDGSKMEESVTEGEVLLFDELNDSFDDLSTKISKLMDRTDDPKWNKALQGMMNQLEKLIGYAAKQDTKLGVINVNEAYSDEERMELAKKGLALGDGSFPIKDLKDLKNAIQAYGRAKDQAKAAKFIAKRAKALGAEDLIPDSEDFQKSLKEGLNERNAFLAARAKAIEEDADEFEFNGKTYPILNRPKSVNEELDHAEAMKIIDAAAMFSDDAHVAANQMWRDKNDLIDYLLSDHIPRKHHKQFLKYIK